MSEYFLNQNMQTMNCNAEQTKFKYDIINSIWKNYNNLLQEIGEYHFYGKWDNSYGNLQNKTNKQILSEILEFFSIVLRVLQNIDNYLINLTSLDNNTFNDEIIIILERIEKNLNETFDYLLNAKDQYHRTWNNVNRPGDYRWHPGQYICDPTCYKLYDRELGEAKKYWRVCRNNACNCISAFYKQLVNIDVKLYDKTFNIDNFNYNLNNEPIVIYYDWLQRIMKSPNYFCYLKEEEKNELSKAKTLKKQKDRNEV